MSFPRYPKYKDSGTEWAGAVPEHWAVQTLGRLTIDKCDGPFGSGLKSEHYVDKGVRVIRLQNIRRDGFDDSDEAFIDEAYFRAELAGHEVRHGDLLIAGLGDDNNTVGRACVAPEGIEPAMVKADCFRFRLDGTKVRAEFIAAQLTAGAIADAAVLSSGSTRSRIPLSLMASRKAFVPPPGEQAAISAFIDHESTKIDSLIEQQARLLELLKEKRQAGISRAVTTGLKPDAPMRPSGIEGLGEVPAHWELTKVKHLTRSIEQGWSPQCEGFPVESDNQWGVLKVGCVNGGQFNPGENKSLPLDMEPIEALSIRAGDLLVSRANTRELVGSAAVAERSYANLLLCDKLYRLRFDTDATHPPFVCHYLRSSAVRGQIELEATGASSSMVNIAQSVIMELPIAIPPIAEQRNITAALDREFDRLSSLTAGAQRAIGLLQERRTALISAAVTGQIDVRGFTARGGHGAGDFLASPTKGARMGPR